MELIFIIISLALLALGTYTDIKTREVPDWLNYSAIFVGFGLRILYSAAYWDYHYILEGVLGFAVFFAIAYFMFYAGQWGGGDAKMIMGLGALLGLSLDVNHFTVSFIVNVIIIGAIYGLLYSFALIFKNWKGFKKQFVLIITSRDVRRAKRAILITVAALIIISYFVVNTYVRIIALVIILFLIVMLYLWILIKSVENSAMIKNVPVKDVTEGDWIASDVIVKGKRICGPKDLGISRRQISRLVKFRVKKVWVKYGMPFVPSFFIAFLIALMWGNIIFWFV
jgi:Flp pilus assembly protein protease CpaA